MEYIEEMVYNDSFYVKLKKGYCVFYPSKHFFSADSLSDLEYKLKQVQKCDCYICT